MVTNNKTRSFLCVLDKGSFLPTKAHNDDAGYDLRTPVCATVPAHGSVCIDTGIHVSLPEGTFGKLESKSGLNVKHGVVSLGGVIDRGYTGTIVAKLYNMSDEDYQFHRGDKIVQMVIQPCMNLPVKEVDSLDDTDRGDNGFGSTGK